MSTATGIDLGPSSCVLVSAREGSTGADVTAVHVIDHSQWPSDDDRLAETLRSAKQSHRLPREARVVAWGLAAPVSLNDPFCVALLKPILAAGFRVEAVLTPAEALARLAETRRRANEGPVAWLSINTHGAAIAIVRGSEVLFSRAFAWTYKSALPTVREQLLQRYSLVSHIAPELQRGISIVRTNYGVGVETVVTCGNLPDLRSLTMPLIEELDLEVETLDSSDGLSPRGAIAQEKLAETAPAIRLAIVAALMPPPRRRAFGFPLRFAAAMLLAVALFGGYLLVGSPDPAPVDMPSDTRVAIQNPPPATDPLPPQDTTATAPSSGSGPANVPVSGLGSHPLPSPPAPRRSPVAPRSERVPRPLPDVPPLTSILIDRGRRLAMFGGSIVGVGDSVGPRVVVRIDQHAVVLREPSGAQITVLLRPGLSDAVKLGPFAGHGRSPSTRTLSVR